MTGSSFPAHAPISVSAVAAIANDLMMGALTAEHQDVEIEDSAGAHAFDLVAWSHVVRDQIAGDARFFDDRDSSHDTENTNMTSEQNRFGETAAFEIGFDLALQIGARIGAAPLAEHDMTDLIASAREDVIAAIMNHRERLHAERARKASAA